MSRLLRRILIRRQEHKFEEQFYEATSRQIVDTVAVYGEQLSRYNRLAQEFPDGKLSSVVQRYTDELRVGICVGIRAIFAAEAVAQAPSPAIMHDLAIVLHNIPCSIEETLRIKI
jgi:hypothetical protein